MHCAAGTCSRRMNPVASARRELPRLLAFFVVAVALFLAAFQTVSGQELGTSDAGYIDGAIIRNQLRFRFDAGFNNPAPDRAEFFYPMCGCLPGGPGPRQAESGVDYQEVEEYLEYAFRPGMSAFVELPIRIIDPNVNANDAGLGDIRAGIKYALIEDCDRWLTFQLRGYFPTGDGRRGLGTEHFSIEPGMLFQRNFDGFSVFSEFKTWVPFGTSTQNVGGVEFDYSGSIVRYGVGFSYDLFQINHSPPEQYFSPYPPNVYPQQEMLPGYSPYRHDSVSYSEFAPDQNFDPYQQSVYSSSPNSDRLAAIVELVGWTIGSGLRSSASTTAPLASTTFDTIVNLKLGLRWTTARDSIYVGSGHALTGDVWYQNLVRAEYAIRF
jgi:hypothetical protein